MDLTDMVAREVSLGLSSRRASAVVLSLWDMFIHPEVISAAILANTMSPVTWEFGEPVKSKGTLPQRLKKIQNLLISEVEFERTESEVGDPWGRTSTASYFGDLFGRENFIALFENVKRVLPQHYRVCLEQSSSIFRPPLWRNFIADLMFGYKNINGKASGKCLSLAMLANAMVLTTTGLNPVDVWVFYNYGHAYGLITGSKPEITSNRFIYSYERYENVKSKKPDLNFDVSSLVGINSAFFYYQKPELRVQGGTVDTNHPYPTNFSLLGTKLLWNQICDFIGGRELPLVDRPTIPCAWFGDRVRPFQSSQEIFDWVKEAASLTGDAVCDASLYAYRSIFVNNPQAYLIAAQIASPTTQEECINLTEPNQIVDFVRQHEKDTPLLSENRIILPDEVLFFGRSTHRDRALMLAHILDTKRYYPLIAFSPEDSFVSYEQGKYISTKDFSLRRTPPCNIYYAFDIKRVYSPQ